MELLGAAGEYGALEREGKPLKRMGMLKGINKLDKVTLNLYTAGRAYGWLTRRGVRRALHPRMTIEGSSVSGRKRSHE
jgi:hypothetical protein